MRIYKHFRYLVCSALLPAVIPQAFAQQEFAGRYTSTVPGMESVSVEIVVSEDNVALKNAVGLQFQLHQDSEAEFHMNFPANSRLQFVAGPSGSVESFIMLQGGQPVRFKRLKQLPGSSPASEPGSLALISADGETIEPRLSPRPQFASDFQKVLVEPQTTDILVDLTVDSGSDSIQGVSGVYKAQGSGMLIEFHGNYTASSYEITRLSCMQGDFQELPVDALLERVNINFDDDAHETMRLRQKGTATVYHFVRQHALPVVCESSGNASTDPVLNFDIVWQTFADHYPVFELREVDWLQQRAIYRPQVTPATTDLELYSILGDMVRPLEDLHVYVNTPFGRFNPGNTQERRSIVANRLRHPQANPIVESYLDDGEYRYQWEDDLKIACINGNILYMQLNSLSPSNPDRLDNDALHQAILAVIDTALVDHPDLEGVIFDLRWNGGGFDSLGVLLASRFTDTVRQAFSEYMLGPEGVSPRVSFNLKPAGPRQYTGPVVLLTSPATTSGAENFAIDMLELPNVTIIGEATAGSISTRQERSLPNGFTFSLPFEYEMAPDGRIFEMTGIQPDVEIENFGAADIENKKDSALEAAIAAIRK